MVTLTVTLMPTGQILCAFTSKVQETILRGVDELGAPVGCLSLRRLVDVARVMKLPYSGLCRAALIHVISSSLRDKSFSDICVSN